MFGKKRKDETKQESLYSPIEEGDPYNLFPLYEDPPLPPQKISMRRQPEDLPPRSQETFFDWLQRTDAPDGKVYCSVCRGHYFPHTH